MKLRNEKISLGFEITEKIKLRNKPDELGDKCMKKEYGDGSNVGIELRNERWVSD